MVKVFNVFRGQDPLGQTLSGLAREFYGNNTANALNNEKLYAAQRANTETDNLMSRVAGGGGAQALGSDPIAQAILLGSGYDPGDFGKIGLMGAATQHGARAPQTQAWQVGTGQSYDNTAGAFDLKLGETRRNNDLQSSDRRYGVDQAREQQMYEHGNLSADQSVDNAEARRNNNMTSADRRYGDNLASRDRRYGVDVGSADRRYEFENTPHSVIGPDGPVIVPQISAPGHAPILSETDQKGTLLGDNFDRLPELNSMQREVLGANPSAQRAPDLYVGADGQKYLSLDGVTDVHGRPVPMGSYPAKIEGGAGDVGLTNAVTTDVQSDIMGANRFVGLADRMLDLTQDPSSFGLIGNLRSKGQELGQAVGAVSSLFGGPQAAQEARRTLNERGLGSLIPELYDPNLPAVAMLGGMLLYSGASALAGQENRSVSDADIIKMKQILGDPMGVFESAQSVRVKVGLAKEIVQEHKRLAEEYLRRGMGIPDDGTLTDEAITNVMSGPRQAAPAAPTDSSFDPLGIR